MNQLANMIDGVNSYIWTKGLALIAYNAKWDKDNNHRQIFEAYRRY